VRAVWAALAGILFVLVALTGNAAGAAHADEILFVGAYTRDATGPSRVLAIRADGSGLRVIAQSAASPRWSPGGSAIVYTPLRSIANGGFAATGLAVTPADSGTPRQITNGTDYALGWSPNGRWIAFFRLEDRKNDLYVVHPDGSALRLVYRKTRPASAASWAPSSRRLLLATRRGPATVDLAGRVRIVPRSTCANDGAFSPDGKLIAMAKCTGSRSDNGIAVERVDGIGFRWLVRPRSRFDAGSPAWSPDGSKLAYTLSRDVKPDYLDHTEIRIVSLAGRRLGNLDSHAEDHDEYSSWSPDGTQIVFDRDTALEPVGEDDRLFVGDVRSGRVRQLYEGTDRGEQSWRPR
jgi:Tol biopolymer transport system component